MDIIIASDAYEHGLVTVIHKYKDGSIKLVVHVSCLLIAAEKRYSQIEKEALNNYFCS